MSRDSQSWPGGGHRVIVTLVLLILLIPSSHQQTQQKASAEIPETSFSCSGRVPGYYADPQTGCQVYHMCEAGGRKFSYRCPEQTLFQQRMMVCDHWFMVDCKSSPQYYAANLLLGDKTKQFVTAEDTVPRALAERTSLKTTPPASSDPSGRSRLPSKKNQRIFNPNSKNNEIPQKKNTTLAEVVEQYTFPSTIFSKSTFSPPLSPQTINDQITNIPFTQTTPSPFSKFTPSSEAPLSKQTTIFPPAPSTFINKLRSGSSLSPTPPTFTSNTIDKLRFASTNINNPTASTLRATSEKPIIALVATPQRKTNSQISVFKPPNPFPPNKIGFNSQPSTKFTIPNRFNNFGTTTIRPTIRLSPTTIGIVNSSLNISRAEITSQTQQNIPETYTRQNTPTEFTRQYTPETTTFNPTTTFNDDLLYPATINSLLSNGNNEPALLQIIPDTRRMFFIPGNFENIPPSQFEEQNLEFEPPEINHFRTMRFNKDIGNFQNGPGCPSKCFPAFFRPGSCEPCVILR